MAVTVRRAPSGPAAVPTRPVSGRHFARLKLRVLRNGLRGQTWRVLLFLAGCLVGLWAAASGFALFALPGAQGAPPVVHILVSAFGGALLVLGWLLLPLVFFGVDETLDPARFALLPLPRRTLISGLLIAALIGVPALATLLATAGLVVAAAVRGGWLAAVLQAGGVAGGVLVCVTVSRAVTSAFAAMLRSRRMRDLAAIVLAALAASLGPLQIAVLAAVDNTQYERLETAARIIGWTPLAAPFTIGADVAEGRLPGALAKLSITALTIVALLAWWSRSLESAMVGSVSAGPHAVRAGSADARDARRGPVSQLFPRLLARLPRDRYGALVAREARYWSRDTRRRANLITFALVGVFLPVMANLGPYGLVGGESGLPRTPALVTLSMLVVGTLAALTLANQFGLDGSAYAAHVVVGVPGRLELRARIAAYSLYLVPMLTVIGIGLALLLREPSWLPMLLGSLYAAYGTGLAVNLFASILGAYALPETANPFAINTGAGVAKSLLSLAALLCSTAAAAPMAVAALLLGDVWNWLALPVGLAYGVSAARLGCYLAGDILDRRAPELLAAITPRR